MEIGKTVTSDKFPNTIDSFWFVLEPDSIINPFDFITVEQAHHTKSIGIVQYSQTIGADTRSASDSYIYNYLIAKSNGLKDQPYSYVEATMARAAVMATAGTKSKTDLSHLMGIVVNMPVGLDRPVRFANSEEIKFALGIPEMTNPIQAGILENSDGLNVPISLDISYLLGPDTAHINVSGISGSSKTSYLLFLLKSTYQKLQKNGEEYALIIFNTKEQDLLHIHEHETAFMKDSNENTFAMLDIELKPFENVTYFLPRGKDGRPNSLHVPEASSNTYSYELEDVYDRLDLLFSEAYDPRFLFSSIVDYILESWPINTRRSRKKIKTWTDLYKFKDYPAEIIAHRSTLLNFQAYIQRSRKSSLFIDEKATSIYLGKKIKEMNSGDIFVIDIAMLSSVEEQSFVIGDVMKSINELYAARTDTSYTNKKTPKYVLIFIDEINRFLPKDKPAGRLNAVAEQIMKTLISGRSRGTILFSAQQFKSSVDYSLHENTGMHVIAKTGLSELATAPYKGIDKHTRLNIVRLNKGELVVVHPAFKYPIKIKFPRANIGKPHRMHDNVHSMF